MTADTLYALAVLARWLGPWSGEDAVPTAVTCEPVKQEGLSAKLYMPARARPLGTYLVAPGLHPRGPDDPRLDRFCRVLAASGLAVVAPRLRDFNALVISPRATDDLAVAFEYTERLGERHGLGAPSIFSISFGSRPAIGLAARASHRARVGGLVLFGGFVDFHATVRFAIDATRPFARADPLNSPVVFLNLLPHLRFDGDREAVARALRTMVDRTWGRAELKVGRARESIAEEIARDLGARERELFLVGCGLREGARELLEEGLASAKDAFDFADPRDDLSRIAAPIVVIHGREDDVIPSDQAHAIAAALGPAQSCRVLVTGMAAHTGTALPPLAAVVAETRTMLATMRAIAETPRAAGLDVRDVFGLRPLRSAAGAAIRAISGSEHAPKNQLGLSSLRIFKPAIGIPTWLGRRRADGRVPVYNLFNRVPAPRGEGYSVRITYARDFRGGRHTYDGHLGTDFAVPVGTPVVAAAPGVVLRVANDFDRGGLKVCIDHGHGLFTTSNHLARALVRPGDRVRRGHRIGLSGASGMEFVTCFPWVAPHLHFNTWLDGEPVDPFAREGEVALWRTGNEPVPFGGGPDGDEEFEPTTFAASVVDAAISACRDPALRARMASERALDRRAAEVLIASNYHAAAFDDFPTIYGERFARRAMLDLPFPAAVATGIVL